MQKCDQTSPGWITAQGRDNPEDTGGFGSAFLGRAYGPYSRVLFYKVNFDAHIVPAGWDVWDQGNVYVFNIVYILANMFSHTLSTGDSTPTS